MLPLKKLDPKRNTLALDLQAKAPLSPAFQAVAEDEIMDALVHDGYFALERAVPSEAVEQILSDVRHLRFEVNRNAAPNVRTPYQTFNTHYLAASKTAFDLITCSKFTNLCALALGPVFRLMGTRIYESRFHGGVSQNNVFHTDLEMPRKTDFDGLSFMIYLTDVTDGEFQFIRGSHRLGLNGAGTPENDERILRDHPDDIVSFRMPRGSIIIYHNRGLHRAKPTKAQGRRQSLLMQVNRDATSGAPIVVDIGFLAGLSEGAKTLLGYGVPPIIQHWPNTSHLSLNLKTDPELTQALAEARLQRRTEEP